jgi:dethiobiotin synthetase
MGIDMSPHAPPATPHGFFVTGTDTGVGKSLVACALLRGLSTRGLRVIGMKPVAAGAACVDGVWVNDDAEALIAASNVQAPREWVNPYCLELPIAPHIAAEEAGISIKNNRLYECFERLAGIADGVIVEGAGGFLVPLNARETLADFAGTIGLPVILVVGMRLGCLSHALLTAEAIRVRGLVLAGWVANHVDADMLRADDNVAALRERLGAPLLARVPHLMRPLAANVVDRIQWDVLFAPSAMAKSGGCSRSTAL